MPWYPECVILWNEKQTNDWAGEHYNLHLHLQQWNEEKCTHVKSLTRNGDADLTSMASSSTHCVITSTQSSRWSWWINFCQCAVKTLFVKTLPRTLSIILIGEYIYLNKTQVINFILIFKKWNNSEYSDSKPNIIVNNIISNKINE